MPAKNAAVHADVRAVPRDGERNIAEHRRLNVLRRLHILGTSTEAAFDDLTRIASQVLRTPMAALTLIDEERQWFKASVGLEQHGTTRDGAFSTHTILSAEPFVVLDALKDPRFFESPYVLGPPHIRFYAGVPVHAAGERIGALCVLDERPRSPSDDEIEALRALGRQVDRLFELRWRRSLAAVPHERYVTDLATQITSVTDFHKLLADEVRPAWLYDRRSLRFLAVNDSAVEQYGFTKSEFLAMTVDEIRPEEDREVFKAVMQNQKAGPSQSRSWRHRRADGSVVDVKVNGAPAVLMGVDARLVIITDLTTRLQGAAALVHAATHDALTGLANRAHFLDTVSAKLEDPDVSQLAVLLVDLDGFKLVNDSAGHATGDALLAASAARIVGAVRDGDIVARLGGDDFAIACPDAGEPEAAEIAARVSRVMQVPLKVSERQYHLTVSTGVAVGKAGTSPAQLVIDADIAMLAAKAAGRNQVAIFDEGLRAAVAAKSTLEQDLHRAIEQYEFELYYQPIIEMDGPAVHFEALIRWHHPTRGLLAPGLFIDAAAECGLIEPIESWVLSEVVAMLGRLREAGFDNRVAFNLPAHQLNESFVTELREVLSHSFVDPHRLIVEVTESAFAGNSSASSTARHLREMGIGLSIDDFGTGFSSLDRLRTLEVDSLKVDRSFTSEAGTTRGRAMIAAIVGLAEAIGVPVVAEGVETREELDAIGALGCHYAQGYLIARPAPEPAAVAFLRDRLGPHVDQSSRPSSSPPSSSLPSSSS